LSYYALTTLSTVGYGDFLPQNHAEKLLMSFVLLIGVTIFSLIMNKLMDVMKDFKDIGYTEGCNPRDLAKWVGLLAKINNGVPLRKDLVTSIEDFFDFYWANDRMRTLKSEADQRITNELQDTFVQQILMEFLYVDFLYIFKGRFVNEAEVMEEAKHMESHRKQNEFVLPGSIAIVD
jgi:hypothetical protein